MEQSFGDMNPVMLFIDFALFRKVHVDNMRRMPSDFKFTLYSSFAEIGGRVICKPVSLSPYLTIKVILQA